MVVHRRKQFVIFDQALFGAPLYMAGKQVQRIAGFLSLRYVRQTGSVAGD
jgi:hypothetical protein